jgi:hypothetical protein
MRNLKNEYRQVVLLWETNFPRQVTCRQLWSNEPYDSLNVLRQSCNALHELRLNVSVRSPQQAPKITYGFLQTKHKHCEPSSTEYLINNADKYLRVST